MRKKMKSTLRFQKRLSTWHWASLLAAYGAASTLSAADAAPTADAAEPAEAATPAETAETETAEAAPEAPTPEQMFEGGPTSYNNWIEFSTGGFFRGGNNAQFQQRHSAPDGPFGGIEDFHGPA